MVDRGFLFGVVLLLLLCLPGCKRAKKVYVAKPVKVEVCVVRGSESGVARCYVGEVEEEGAVALSFAAGGRLERLSVHEGDRVKKGELLAVVDRRASESAYAAAKATLDEAEDGYRRMKQVWEQGAVAEVKWVEMQSNLERARSMEAIARKQLSDCSMKAPFDGVVGKCDVRVGATLLPGQTVVTLLDVGRVQVAFSVPESEVGKVDVGSEGRVEIPALEGYSFPGVVCSRGVTANRLAHSYTLRIGIENAERKLLPGMVCKVYLPEEKENGFVIPSNCLQTRPEGTCAWKVEGGKAKRVAVHVGGFVANGVLVDEGVECGDSIVVKGFQKLYEGAEVCVD